MKTRIVGVALASAVLAVALFAIPLAIAVQRLYLSDAQGALERTALRTAVTIGPDFAGHDPAEIPVAAQGDALGLYSPAGQRVSGTGPNQADAATIAALRGGVGQEQDNGSIVAAVPVSSAETVVGAVRAAAPTADIWRRTVVTWAAMALVGALAIGVAVLAARVLARRVSRPLEELAVAAHQLGDGDFHVRSKPTGIPEIDDAGASLNLTAERLGDLVTRERQIAANASHQLRTPLTGLRATLESALADPTADLAVASRQAIASADQLELTIQDLIALTRGPTLPTETVQVRPVLEEVARRWHGPLAALGRPLTLSVALDLPAAMGSPNGLTQVLDILLENALKHGHGPVTIAARSSDAAIAIDVADAGKDIDQSIDIFDRGVSTAGSSGIGLALARAIAEDTGGRLRLSQRKPTTCFTLLIPGVPPHRPGVAKDEPQRLR